MEKQAKIIIAVLIALVLFLAVAVFLLWQGDKISQNELQTLPISSFEECVSAGNPVMESHPRQCSTLDGRTFVEQIQKEEAAEDEKQEQIVGDDADEHGCIGSAGYSWCETKNKCLRIWEEECEEASPESEIQNVLAQKHSRPIEEVNVSILKSGESHIAGGVMFGQGGPGEGGMFLAVRQDGAWQVVFDGNGNPDCEKLKTEYGFPAEILSPNFCD